ncbi:MAG: cation:proton antiporter [Myxococcota bacterium]
MTSFAESAADWYASLELGGNEVALVWMGAALAFGIVAARLRQPPVIGFLLAGFGLELIGMRSDATLDLVASVGIKLLLFTVGLKLDLRGLAKPHVWRVAVMHIIASVGFGLAYLWLLSKLGLGALAGLDVATLAMIAFALSFSSTIFAVRVLQTRNDLAAFYGTIAIGILVVQDLAAVAFVSVKGGVVPSPWALGLLALPFAWPVLRRIIDFCGHGELLLLAGLALPLGFSGLFSVVDVKGDLGALIAGVLVARHSRAGELAEAVAGPRDLLLVAFFLSVGLTGFPNLEVVLLAAALLALLPLKGVLFFLLGLLHNLRARTATLLAISLGQFSEFGLIVLAALVSAEMLDGQVLVALALALSISFLLSAVLQARAQKIEWLLRRRFGKFESTKRLPDEQVVFVGDAEVLVVGMGRVGIAAYDRFKKSGLEVLGFDVSAAVVEKQRALGREVVRASGSDQQLWSRVDTGEGPAPLVVVAMSSHVDHLLTVKALRRYVPGARVAVVANYVDEVPELLEAGAALAVHVLTEAGAGFAEHVLRELPADPAEAA